jgi:hypothetical protein
MRKRRRMRKRNTLWQHTHWLFTLHSLYKKTQQTNLAIPMFFLFLPTICCWCSKDWKVYQAVVISLFLSLFVCLLHHAIDSTYHNIKQWLFYLVGKARSKGQPWVKGLWPEARALGCRPKFWECLVPKCITSHNAQPNVRTPTNACKDLSMSVRTRPPCERTNVGKLRLFAP